MSNHITTQSASVAQVNQLEENDQPKHGSGGDKNLGKNINIKVSGTTPTPQVNEPAKQKEMAERQAALDADKAQKDCLEKQNSILCAWEKWNKAIFRGAGKMTAGAYGAKVKNVTWEPKFLTKGKKMQVNTYQLYINKCIQY